MSRSSLHLDSPRQPLARPGAGSPAPAGNVTTEPAVASGSQPSPAPRRHGGDNWRYSSQLNQQLTAAQRALGFVDGLAGQLEALKGELSGQLTQRRVDSARLARGIEQVAQHWSQRSAARPAAAVSTAACSSASPPTRGRPSPCAAWKSPT